MLSIMLKMHMSVSYVIVKLKTKQMLIDDSD